MKQVKNIIFDYGNVIFLIDFKRSLHSFTELGIENMERFFGHTGQDPIFDEFDKGTIGTQEFYDGIRRITGLPGLSDEQIKTAWNSLLIGVPPVNHEILLRAKEKYRTFLLSNNNAIHYQWILDYLASEYKLQSNDGFFEKSYYSHLLGMRKPDAAIFEYLLRDTGIDPTETLYIDDSPQHIRTGAALGLQTHLLTPDEPLEQFIHSAGLL